MTLLSQNRIKKIRERFTGRVRYVAESQIKIRGGKLWIKINPCLLRRAHLYQGSPVVAFAKPGVRMVVVRRLRSAKGNVGRAGIY